MCMQHHQETQHQRYHERVTKLERNASQTSQRTEENIDDEVNSVANRSESSEYTLYEKSYSIPRPLYDPPPLDDELTDYISTVLSTFFFQMQIYEDQSSNGQYMSNPPPSPLLKRTDSITSLGPDTSGELIVDIYNNVRKILFYTSASNWTTYFARVRARLAIFSATTEEVREWCDLRLIECASVNSRRLGQILRGMCA